MVAIGEALVERSFCHFDNVLGYVAMASGYYFGTPDDVDYALKLVHDAVELIESDDFFRVIYLFFIGFVDLFLHYNITFCNILEGEKCRFDGLLEWVGFHLAWFMLAKNPSIFCRGGYYYYCIAFLAFFILNTL